MIMQVWKASMPKKEEVNVNNYETFNEAKLAIFEFIESWYNNQRIHSTIGYITPNEKYNNYIASLALAQYLILCERISICNGQTDFIILNQ